MSGMPKRLAVSIFTSILVLAVVLWFELARKMPLHYFAWFCLLAGAFVGVELMLSRFFAEGVQQKRHFKILLELALGVLFVTALYLFATHVYPGTK